MTRCDDQYGLDSFWENLGVFKHHKVYFLIFIVTLTSHPCVVCRVQTQKGLRPGSKSQATATSMYCRVIIISISYIVVDQHPLYADPDHYIL